MPERRIEVIESLLSSVGSACRDLAKGLERLQKKEISLEELQAQNWRQEATITTLVEGSQDTLNQAVRRRGRVQDIYIDVTRALTLLGKIGGGGDFLTEELCSLLEKLELAAALLQYPLADCLNSLLATMTECNNAILFATLMKALAPILSRALAMIIMDKSSMFGSGSFRPYKEIIQGDGSLRLGLKDVYKWESRH